MFFWLLFIKGYRASTWELHYRGVLAIPLVRSLQLGFRPLPRSVFTGLVLVCCWCLILGEGSPSTDPVGDEDLFGWPLFVLGSVSLSVPALQR